MTQPAALAKILFASNQNSHVTEMSERTLGNYSSSLSLSLFYLDIDYKVISFSSQWYFLTVHKQEWEWTMNHEPLWVLLDNKSFEALIIIIIKADDIEMGNIQVRKRKSMTLKNEFSFMGTVHEASNNARNDDESNTYLLKISWFWYFLNIADGWKISLTDSHDQLQK